MAADVGLIVAAMQAQDALVVSIVLAVVRHRILPRDSQDVPALAAWTGEANRHLRLGASCTVFEPHVRLHGSREDGG
jgi:hypothetical protein